MAEFASDDKGAYSIASFYKYAVAKYNLYIYWFLKLYTAYFIMIVCRFDLDFSTTFYTVFVSLPSLADRRATMIFLSTSFSPAPRVLHFFSPCQLMATGHTKPFGAEQTQLHRSCLER